MRKLISPIKVISLMCVLVFCALIYFNFIFPNHEIKSFEIYYKDFFIKETGSNFDYQEQVSLLDIMNAMRMRYNDGRTSYYYNHFSSRFDTFKLNMLLNQENIEASESILDERENSRLICVVNFSNTKKDTISYSTNSMFFNSHECK